MTETRHIKNSFTKVPNEMINNRNISLAAKGIFAYIQSKPIGWDFSAEKISHQTSESPRVVNKYLKELESNGYLVRTKKSNGRGKWVIEYQLSLYPNTSNDNTSNDNTSNDNTSDVKSTNKVIKSLSNKELSKKDEDEERKEKKQLPSPSTTISDDLIKKLEAATGSLLQAEQILSQNLTKERIVSIVERNDVMTYFEYFDYFQQMDSLTMENTARSRSEDVRTFNKNMNAFCSSIVKSQKIDEYTSKKNFWMHFNNFINKIKAK